VARVSAKEQNYASQIRKGNKAVQALRHDTCEASALAISAAYTALDIYLILDSI
jgi:hypothetical protein